MTVLDVEGGVAPGMRIKVCTECGTRFGTATHHGGFCTTTCRKAWNNRRAVRGAAVFDLLMTLRFERGIASKLHVWRMLCRLAADFRAEDHEQREARRSWRPIRDVLAERPYLNAVTMSDRTWGVAGK